MPLYEYECTSCNRRTEKIQKFSDPELTTCPHCGGPLQRTLTAPAIQFKGSGWYKDLYSSAKPAAPSSGENAAGASAAAPAEGSSAPKSDTAAPATQSTAAAAPSPAPSASNPS